MLRGRPVVEETTHTYDDEGRVVKTRTIRQSEWTREDRLLAMAVDAYERSLCGGCGQPRDRAWDPRMSIHFAADEVECHGCNAIHDRSRQIEKDDRSWKIFAVDLGPAELPPPPIP